MNQVDILNANTFVLQNFLYKYLEAKSFLVFLDMLQSKTLMSS